MYRRLGRVNSQQGYRALLSRLTSPHAAKIMAPIPPPPNRSRFHLPFMRHALELASIAHASPLMYAAIFTASAIFATEKHVCCPTGFSSAALALTFSGQQRRLSAPAAFATTDFVRLVCGVRGRCSGAHKPSFRGESGQLVAEAEDKLVSYSLVAFVRHFSSPSAEVTRHPHA